MLKKVILGLIILLSTLMSTSDASALTWSYQNSSLQTTPISGILNGNAPCSSQRLQTMRVYGLSEQSLFCLHGDDKITLGVGYGFYLKNNGNKSWFLDKTCHKSTVPARKVLSISKSIHTRPDDYVTFPYSSIRAYLYDDVPKWLDKSHIAKRYNSALKYSELLNSTL